MLIRKALVEDAALLTNIHSQCFPHYWNSEAFTNFFGISGTVALLAEVSEPVGMSVYRVQHEQADIITLAVRPAWRRQGIARQLLERIVADVAAMGAISLFLDVEEGNEAALALYQRYGFAQIGRRRQYYRQKDGSFTDALVMTRKLAVASGQQPV